MHFLKIISYVLFVSAFVGSLLTSTKYVSVGIPIIGFICFVIALGITTESNDSFMEFLFK